MAGADDWGGVPVQQQAQSDDWGGVPVQQQQNAPPKAPDTSGIEKTVQTNLAQPQTSDSAQPQTDQQRMDTGLGMPVKGVLTGNAQLTPDMRGHLVDAYKNGTATTPVDFMQSALPAAVNASSSVPDPSYSNIVEQAFVRGFKANLEAVKQTGQTIFGQTPEQAIQPTDNVQKYLTAPYQMGWPDFKKIIGKTVYGLTESAPEIGAAVAGGAAGIAAAGGPEDPAAALTGPIGSGIAAAGVHYAKELAPAYAEALKSNGGDQEKAWQAAKLQTGIGAAGTGISFALFGFQPFESAVKNVLTQAFAVQPIAGAAQQAATNIATGQPLTQGVGQAAVESGAGAAVPLSAHVLLKAASNAIPGHEALKPVVGDAIGKDPSQVTPQDINQTIASGVTKMDAPKAQDFHDVATVMDNSKAQGEDFQTGKPATINAYHGTPRDFDNFETTSVNPEGHHFFTNDVDIAKSYANEPFMGEEGQAQPNIRNAQIQMDNPKVIDAGGKTWAEIGDKGTSSNYEAHLAQAEGHDGLIIKNVKDAVADNDATKPSDVYVSFDANKINNFSKSTVDNLHEIYKQTGIKPDQVFEDAKNDPTVAADLNAGKIPTAYDGLLEHIKNSEGMLSEDSKPINDSNEPAYASVPKEPTRLIDWIKKQGGIRDTGGDVKASIGGAKGRPGLISENGLSADDLALRAQEAGYFSGTERPDVNTLLNKIREDHEGTPQYSFHDTNAAQEYNDAHNRNSEIDRISNETGIKAKGKTHTEFWNAVAQHMSFEKQLEETQSMTEAHIEDLKKAEAMAEEWARNRGEAWEPNAVEGEPATLEDLENERAKENAARRTTESNGSLIESRLTAGDQEPLQVSGGQGGGGVEPPGRGGEEPNGRGSSPGEGGGRSTEGASTSINPLAKIFNPAGMSEASRDMATALRQGRGPENRDVAAIQDQLQKYNKDIKALSDQDRLALIDYMENRSQGAKNPLPQLQEAVDAIRDIYQQYANKIKEAFPDTGLREDYFTHQYEDEGAAKKFFSDWVASQGSERNLKERTFPTLAEAMQAGLKPKTTNPIETVMTYIGNMARLLAADKTVKLAQEYGVADYFRKGQQPDGWVPLNSNFDEKDGKILYAPEDAARVYNNDSSEKMTGPAGDILDAVQRFNNFTSKMVLGLSGYHFSATTMASMASDVANGNYLKAVTPFANVVKGGKYIDAYLGRDQLAPELQKALDLAIKNNTIAVKQQAYWKAGPASDYIDVFKNGSISEELGHAADTIKAQPIIGPVRVLGGEIGRVMDTVAKPLFDHYIPRIKIAANIDELHNWLSEHPDATPEEQDRAAQDIGNSIDNRFGEMMRDNLFWHQITRQTLQTALLSYSWVTGAARMLGGVKDIGSTIMSAGGKELTSNAKYLMGMAATYAVVNGVRTYIGTGQAPDDWKDFVYPRTGGTTPQGQPERELLPGHTGQFTNYLHDGLGELGNELTPGLKLLYHLTANQDYRGLPITNDNNGWFTEQRWGDYLKYTLGEETPIGLKNFLQGEKKGSNISTVEQVLGVRPAPRFINDPEGYQKMMERVNNKAFKSKEHADQKLKKQYNDDEDTLNNP